MGEPDMQEIADRFGLHVDQLRQILKIEARMQRTNPEPTSPVDDDYWWDDAFDHYDYPETDD